MIREINFNVVKVEIFVPVISSEPGDHPLPNLLLFSSNFIDEKKDFLGVWVQTFYCSSSVGITDGLSLLCSII